MTATTHLRHAMLTGALLCGTALAATGVSIDAERAEFNLQPGASASHAINVLNPGKTDEAPLNVKSYLNDFTLPNSGPARFTPPGSTASSLASWIRFTPDKFTLAPGKSQQVRYTIQVPATAKPGLYWGVLFFNSEAPEEQRKLEKGASLQYGVDVGQVIYVQVGTGKTEGKLSQLNASLKDGQLQVETTIKNSGSTVIRAAGRAQVRDKTGKVLVTLPFEQDAALPGYSRTFASQVANTLAPGEYQVLVALQYAKGKFFFGETKLAVK